LIQESKETNSCGSMSTSQCSHAVKVWAIGDTFAIFFAGERLNQNVTLDLNTDGLIGFEPEMFQNRTNDILARNSDVAYGDLEYLDIMSMGDHDIVVNVRGTTAITSITTQGGDDTFFVSSEANQNTANAGSVDVLLGWLDYVEEDLYLVAQTGRHRLLISDENSTINKGYDRYGEEDYGPVVLTRNSLTDIHPDVGDILFTAEGGDWSDGVNLWLGKSGDRLHVDSVPSNPSAAPLRTTTSIHCGNGDDIMTVRLIDDDHDGTVFVANGQAGNDVIDASPSSLAVILFGDDGSDVLSGGSGNDVLIGDYGRVVWRSSLDNIFSSDGVIAAIAGGGGYGDFTDGVIRHITDIYAVATDEGATDRLIMNAGDDVGIGGPFGDTIEGNNGNDIIVSIGGAAIPLGTLSRDGSLTKMWILFLPFFLSFFLSFFSLVTRPILSTTSIAHPPSC
jgi:Ca2+-binding RTX toxin-like protein